MSELYGGDYIYEVLSNDSDIIDLVSTSIYNARVIPSDETSYDTINFYPSGTFNAALDFFTIQWSIDCRSKDDFKAYNIASAVVGALNRLTGDIGGYKYFGTCEILPIIPPANEQDVFNVPVQILLRRR
jgi:hypothetical protein